MACTAAIGGDYTSSGSIAIITDAGVLSVYVATTVDGASTLTDTITIGGAPPYHLEA